MYEFEIWYKLQGKTVGKSSVRKSFSVFSASLTDCHHGVKLHVGKRERRRNGGTLLLVLVVSDTATSG